ncbi:MAG: protease complex subunit PrcB family protein [Bacillota bacterium]
MLIKQVLVFTLALSALLAFGCAGPAENGENGEEAGEVIEPIEPGEELPSEIETWVEESKYHFGGDSRIYDDQRYILAAYGERPTGGYSVEITSIKRKEDKIVVTAHFTAPEEGEPVTQAITYPYDLVVIEETELPVDFGTTGDDDVEGLR